MKIFTKQYKQTTSMSLAQYPKSHNFKEGSVLGSLQYFRPL